MPWKDVTLAQTNPRLCFLSFLSKLSNLSNLFSKKEESKKTANVNKDVLNKSHQEMSEPEFTYSSLYHYAKKNPQSANNDYRSSYIKGQKEELKVVLVVQEPYIYKNPGTDEYIGIINDVWQKMKQTMGEKYIFKETYVKTLDYNSIINRVSSGEFDFAVGAFSTTKKRSDIITYSQGVILNKNIILHMPPRSNIETLLSIIFQIFLPPILALFVLGLVFGYLLFMSEPERFKKVVNVEKKFALRRAITSATASLLGEAGFVSENSTLKFPGLLVVFTLLILSFYSSIYLQAQTTDRIRQIREYASINRTSIQGRKILCPEGYAAGKVLESLGAKVEYVKDMKMIDIIDKYIKNKEEYAGIAMLLMDAIYLEDPTIDLKVSSADFGFDVNSFVANKNKDYVLKDVNSEIFKLHSSNEIEQVCKGYLDTEYTNLCVM